GCGGHSWHSQQRFGVLSARFALDRGDPDRAAETAAAVIADAEERGTARYHALAVLAAARARLAVGDPVDHDALDGVLGRLDRLAGLEAWLATAELAAAAGVGRLWRGGQRRAGWPVANPGEHGGGGRRCL